MYPFHPSLRIVCQHKVVFRFSCYSLSPVGLLGLFVASTHVAGHRVTTLFTLRALSNSTISTSFYGTPFFCILANTALDLFLSPLCSFFTITGDSFLRCQLHANAWYDDSYPRFAKLLLATMVYHGLGPTILSLMLFDGSIHSSIIIMCTPLLASSHITGRRVYGCGWMWLDVVPL
jgi:hypothetical protein